MAENKTKTDEADVAPAANETLEHTMGGVTTRDGMDAGVPMTAGDPAEPIGPEDAFGPGPKRGDYSDRVTSGPSYITEVIPADERRKEAARIAKASDGGLTEAQAMAEVPATRLVRADARAAEQGDEPGKGGVPGSQPREDVTV